MIGNVQGVSDPHLPAPRWPPPTRFKSGCADATVAAAWVRVCVVDRRFSVLLVSEYPVIRRGLAACLRDLPTVGEIHESDSLKILKGQILTTPIDIIVADLLILNPSGLVAIKALLKLDPGLRIIVLGHDEMEPFITRSFEQGALGYISKRCGSEDLLEAINTVQSGEKYISRDLAFEYAMGQISGVTHPLSKLTSREYQVFTLLAQGKTTKEIANLICISPKTVHVYRANVLSKTQVSTNSELTLLAVKHGVIAL